MQRGKLSLIPVSAIVVTRDEECNLARCLAALKGFDEVVVVDSNSQDATKTIAESFGARVVPFEWNGRYPKKRQWCLDHLSLKHERIFFVDADEELTGDLCHEIAGLDWKAAGYFVRGAYVVDGTPLKYGLKNNKLCLFDRTKMAFPVVDDLDLPGMGEMEGHYQPVLKSAFQGSPIGQVKNPLLHHAFEDADRWIRRHAGYAVWEIGVLGKNLSLREDDVVRSFLKKIFCSLPCRSWAAFGHSYIIRLGFLDGYAGYRLACSRRDYYKLQEARRA